jgi:SAM-dependent methyltransferase
MKIVDAETTIKAHREIWDKKPVLRKIYSEYFALIKNACIDGVILEIGGGSGNFKEYLPESITMDIVSLPWIDVIADAQKLPIKNNSIANIVMVDVLHHIELPVVFFREVKRVLQPGGRLIFIEPAITPLSWIILHLFHKEPVDLEQNPLLEKQSDPARMPFDANQAIPTLLFKRYRTIFCHQFPELKITTLKYLDCVVYPLSGGFRPWCLIPVPLTHFLLKTEQKLIRILGPVMAFRMYCVIEKVGKIS